MHTSPKNCDISRFCSTSNSASNTLVSDLYFSTQTALFKISPIEAADSQVLSSTSVIFSVCALRCCSAALLRSFCEICATRITPAISIPVNSRIYVKK